MKFTRKFKLIMKKTLLRAKKLIRKPKTQLVVMFQAPIGKQPLDILVDETYKIIMLTKAEELMLNEFFAQAAFPDAPHYELDQFFATQFPLAVDYGLDYFFAQAAFPDAPEYELDQFFNDQFTLVVDYALDTSFAEAAIPNYELDLIFNEQYSLPANESELTCATADAELNLAATEKPNESAREYEDKNAREYEDKNMKGIKNLGIKRSMSCSIESVNSVQRVSLMKRYVSAVEL